MAESRDSRCHEDSRTRDRRCTSWRSLRRCHDRAPRSRHCPAERRTARGLLESERGDVPGWVLVTLMTAGLVIALWAIAGPALQSVFESAIAQVTGSHP